MPMASRGPFVVVCRPTLNRKRGLDSAKAHDPAKGSLGLTPPGYPMPPLAGLNQVQDR